MTDEDLRFFPNKSVWWLPEGSVHLVSPQDMYLDLQTMSTLFKLGLKRLGFDFPQLGNSQPQIMIMMMRAAKDGLLVGEICILELVGGPKRRKARNLTSARGRKICF